MVLFTGEQEELFDDADACRKNHINSGAAVQITKAAACNCAAGNEDRLWIRRNMFAFRQTDSCLVNLTFMITDIAYKLI